MIKSQMASTGLLKTPAYPSVDSQNYAGPGVHVKEDAWERQGEQTRAVVFLQAPAGRKRKRSWGDGPTALGRNGAWVTAPT